MSDLARAVRALLATPRGGDPTPGEADLARVLAAWEGGPTPLWEVATEWLYVRVVAARLAAWLPADHPYLGRARAHRDHLGAELARLLAPPRPFVFARAPRPGLAN